MHLLALVLIGLSLFGPKTPKDSYANVNAVIAIGDVHGDVERLREALRSARVIDAGGKWVAGKDHLVQTGDLLDRGPDSLKAVDLMMDLEKQAEKAGGRVHALIGNHEMMNVLGDLRYVPATDWALFAKDDTPANRKKLYALEKKQGRTKATFEKWQTLCTLGPKGFPVMACVPGYWGRRFAFSTLGKYGQWILNHNTAVKIDDTLFLHGGLSPRYATTSLTIINEEVRKALTAGDAESPYLKMEGPAWYRCSSPTADAEDGCAASLDVERSVVDPALKAHGARRIVVGHSVQPAILAFYGGKVVMIDVALSHAIRGGAGPLGALELSSTKANLLDAKALYWDKSIEIPIARAGLDKYFAAILLRANDVAAGRVKGFGKPDTKVLHAKMDELTKTHGAQLAKAMK